MAIQFPFYTLRQTLLSIAITILVPSIAFLSSQVVSRWHKQPTTVASTAATQAQQPAVKSTTQNSVWNKQSRKSVITFSIMTTLGLIAFFYGIFTRVMYLSSGFINGGLVSLSIGYLVFYNPFDDLLTLVILILILVAILLLAHRTATAQTTEAPDVTQ